MTTRLDHFPEMIIYQCLEDSDTDLEKAADLALRSEHVGQTETITMPRRGYGPRPVEVLSPTIRVAYEFSTQKISKWLPESSRAPGRWKEHKTFGMQDRNCEYIVDIDIASCYEYIDHEVLLEEILIRTFDDSLVASLKKSLKSVGHLGRGLPQMLKPSDRLADTYLSIIDRRIAREGISSHRFADDFRALSNSWNEAHRTVDKFSEIARGIGLSLSSTKTSILLQKTVSERQGEEETVDLSNKEDDTEGSRNLTISIVSPYDDMESEEDTEKDTDLGANAANTRGSAEQLIRYWSAEFDAAKGRPATPRETELSRFIPTALAVLSDHKVELPDKFLENLAYREPLRMEHICTFLSAQSAAGWNIAASDDVAKLTKAQNGPWAKIWLMSVIECLPTALAARHISWMRDALTDEHEVVRAQAAWTISRFEDFDNITLQLTQLYVRATTVSQHAIAAAAARHLDVLEQTSLDRTTEVIVKLQKFINAVSQDSRLNKAAVKWTQSRPLTTSNKSRAQEKDASHD
jgi:RNA-directed DNA polymerase